MTLPPWLVDTSVLTTLITVSGGFLATLTTQLMARREKVTKEQYRAISETLETVTNQLETIQANTELVKDGTKKIQRYRLHHDLTRDILQGYTYIDDYRELTILFEAYQDLGGNGEVEKLYRQFEKLPIKARKE